MSVARFGLLDNGVAVERISLSGGGISLQVLTLGSIIQDLGFDAGRGPERRVLGFEQLGDYVAHSPYCGCVAGRYANRIAEGRCVIDGKTYQLPRNESGRTHLHGGETGFSHRVWQILDHGPHHVTLELISADGDQGYPGTLTTRCTYRLGDGGRLSDGRSTGDGTLEITLTATTDAPTIVNLATHSYFNLDGGADILDHVLEIPASNYLPVDAHRIPTGEIAPVFSTPFDFRPGRTLRAREGEPQTAYDHNFVLGAERTAAPRLAARLTGPASRTQLEILSTEPGLQFYDGARVGPLVPGHDGRRYGAYAGLCLEPQIFPDSPNQKNFPDPTLRPGETYRQVTLYRFSAL